MNTDAPQWDLSRLIAGRLVPLFLAISLAAAGCSPVVLSAGGLTPQPELTSSSPPPEPTFTSDLLSKSPTAPVTPTPKIPYLTGQASVYPGPEHYAGDVLTVEIPVHNMVHGLSTLDTTVSIDGSEAFEFKARVVPGLIDQTTEIVLPYVWDTAGQAGQHSLRVQARLPRGVLLDVTAPITLRPESERPERENVTGWVMRKTECCRLYYVRGTAAERDIDRLAGFAEQSVADVAQAFDLDLERFDPSFFFLDTVWGNGGYASEDGIVIYYVDRDFGPGIGDEILTTFRHEVTHQAHWMLETAEAAGYLNEGLAVYAGGGHYFRQPIPARAAALYRAGDYVPVLQLPQAAQTQAHELHYLEVAGLVAYLVETYGWESFLDFYTTLLPEKADNQAWNRWLAGALQANFDLTVEQLESGFTAWLSRIEPGDQVENLRLTVRLQEARRQYQVRHAPYLELYALGDLVELEQMSLVTREDRSPEAAAIETLIQSAQLAVYHGDTPAAETMLEAIETFLATEEFSHPLAAQYLSVARTLAEWGYEAQEITLEGGEVRAVVTGESADLQALTLVCVDDAWQLATD